MKKRYKILLSIIALLIVWALVWSFLPVGDGNWNEKQIQKINSVQTQDSFCFAVMGDNKNGFSTFSRIIKDVNQKAPLFAIDLGDLVADGEKEKYRIFYNQIQKTEVPFLVALGNHDITDKGRNNYLDIFGDFYYSFSYGDSLFIILDDANEMYIDEQQMEFLENELKKDFKFKFVMLHVPPFEPADYHNYLPEFVQSGLQVYRSLANKENADQFMALMSNYKVTAVFASHIHGYFKEEKDNIPYIITGGAGGEILSTAPSNYFYHYVNVCVNNDGINYEVVKFPSPENNLKDRLSYALWLYVWYYIVSHRTGIAITILILVLILNLIYEKIKDQKQTKKEE